jgi:hypothetical protein
MVELHNNDPNEIGKWGHFNPITCFVKSSRTLTSLKLFLLWFVILTANLFNLSNLVPYLTLLLKCDKYTIPYALLVPICLSNIILLPIL